MSKANTNEAKTSLPTYPCPQCDKAVVWCRDNAYRPFCSQRCQQIDLGAWVTEEYAIAGDNDESEVLTEQLLT